MSKEDTLKKIKEYKDLYEKEKKNMSEIEKMILSPDALVICEQILKMFPDNE